MQSTQARARQMARKQFNFDLLPTQKPEKYTSMKPRRKSNNNHRLIGNFFRKYINLERSRHDETNGEYKFDFAELSRLCGVKEQTVKNWLYGRCPGRYTHTIIARYFSQSTGVRMSEIYNELVELHARVLR